MSAKLKIITSSVVLVCLFAIGAGVMASGSLGPISPLDSEEADNLMVAANLTLPPSDMVTYIELPNGIVEFAGDRPVAVLDDESTTSARPVSAYYSDPGYGSADQHSGTEIVFTILSSIKYTSATGDILVTTTKPSSAAAAKSLLLGAREIKLANNVTAWATEYSHGDYPNRVIFVYEELIITVASSLPIDEVQSFAAHVQVKRP